MVKIYSAAIALSLLVAVPSAKAQAKAQKNLHEAQTAKTLARMCEATRDHAAAITNVYDGLAAGLCIGEILGFRTVVDFLPVLTPARTERVNIAPETTNATLEKVFVAYVALHPEVNDKPDFLVFCLALLDAGLFTFTPASQGTK